VSVAVDILLALAVACASLGAAGFALLASEEDRLHCVGFVAVAAGFAITLAVFLTHPFAAVAIKAAALYIASVASGAVLVHATGRALHLRREDSGGGEETTP